MERLAEKHPSAVAQLTMQYRMHGDICDLCNMIVYKGSLQCADENVKVGKLHLDHYPSRVPRSSIQLPLQNNKIGDEVENWLLQVLNPTKAVVFVNTDALGSPCDKQPESTFFSLERSGRNSKQRGGIVNDTEVIVIRHIIYSLLECGMQATETGVICPYRSQVSDVGVWSSHIVPALFRCQGLL